VSGAHHLWEDPFDGSVRMGDAPPHSPQPALHRLADFGVGNNEYRMVLRNSGLAYNLGRGAAVGGGSILRLRWGNPEPLIEWSAKQPAIPITLVGYASGLGPEFAKNAGRFPLGGFSVRSEFGGDYVFIVDLIGFDNGRAYVAVSVCGFRASAYPTGRPDVVDMALTETVGELMRDAWTNREGKGHPSWIPETDRVIERFSEGSSIFTRTILALCGEVHDVDPVDLRGMLGVAWAPSFVDSSGFDALGANREQDFAWAYDLGMGEESIFNRPRGLDAYDDGSPPPSADGMAAYSSSEPTPEPTIVPAHADTRLPIEMGSGSWWVEQTRCKACGQRVILRLPEGPLSGDPPKPKGLFRCPACRASDSVTLLNV
jgi:hypothetical protein